MHRMEGWIDGLKTVVGVDGWKEEWENGEWNFLHNNVSLCGFKNWWIKECKIEYMRNLERCMQQYCFVEIRVHTGWIKAKLAECKYVNGWLNARINECF